MLLSMILCIGGAPAAFGRLCVETFLNKAQSILSFPAAFGRLCVETWQYIWQCSPPPPAAFGRLCVETLHKSIGAGWDAASRLRAAVC